MLAEKQGLYAGAVERERHDQGMIARAMMHRKRLGRESERVETRQFRNRRSAATASRVAWEYQTRSAMQKDAEHRMTPHASKLRKVLDAECLILYGARGTWWVCRGSIDDLGLSPSAVSH